MPRSHLSHLFSMFCLGVCPGALLAVAVSVGCTAQISAKDPQAVAAHNASVLASRTPIAFPSPDDAPGVTRTSAPSRTGTPGPIETATPVPSAPASESPTPEASATPEPSATPTVVPTGTPTTATVTEVIKPEAKIYKIGDEVPLRVKFSTPVIWTGVPLLELSGGGKVFGAEPILGFGTDSVLFQYVVKPGDTAPALTLATVFKTDDGTLMEKNGGMVTNVIPTTSFDASFRFEGTQGVATKVTLPANGTYTETFDVEVEFDTEVTLRGTPYLRLRVDTENSAGAGVERHAPAVAVSGKKVTFRYTVEPGDADTQDGVAFFKEIAPGTIDPTSDAVVGANGNPVSDSLVAAGWTGGPVIKVSQMLPKATLYARFRAEQGRLFAAPDASVAACNVASSVASAGGAVGCWQETSGLSPYWVNEPGAMGTNDTRPLLDLAAAPFTGPSLRFPWAAGENARSLKFPTQGAPMLGASAKRFVAFAFSHPVTPAGAPLLWLDDTRAVTLAPQENQLRFVAGAKTGSAVVEMPSLGPHILGILDDGTQTEVVLWTGNSAVRRAVTVVGASGADNSVFNFPLEGARLGGQIAGTPATPAFQGSVGEVLFYGSLTNDEQARVLCALARAHAGFSGSCFP